MWGSTSIMETGRFSYHSVILIVISWESQEDKQMRNNSHILKLL